MKVLVADDDPVTLDAVSACLREEGFDVLPAANGTEALHVWQESKPDLLCLDIMMPEINGYDVCRRVRAEDSRVPILFLSAKSEEIDVVVGLELGADDFVRKPFGKRELLARVHAILRRGEEQPLAERKQFAMRDLTIFPKELRAIRDGLPEIRLSPRELSILELLHSRPGEVINRDVFFDHCWGIDYYPESRTLDQHIARLRKRIEHDPANPEIIETVRGVGYRWRGEE
ncbi:MAG: two-component system alkaline phosphatase synthesis response regulator PhoP [Verrucomicrobiales bacterium]|jgi:two-component system alkaline phosphatase synthesis response regulator PhoP